MIVNTPSGVPMLRAALCLVAVAQGHAAWTGVLGLSFDSNQPVEAKSLHCPSGFITGIRVRYGRTKSVPCRRHGLQDQMRCTHKGLGWVLTLACARRRIEICMTSSSNVPTGGPRGQVLSLLQWSSLFASM